MNCTLGHLIGSVYNFTAVGVFNVSALTTSKLSHDFRLAIVLQHANDNAPMREKDFNVVVSLDPPEDVTAQFFQSQKVLLIVCGAGLLFCLMVCLICGICSRSKPAMNTTRMLKHEPRVELPIAPHLDVHKNESSRSSDMPLGPNPVSSSRSNTHIIHNNFPHESTNSSPRPSFSSVVPPPQLLPLHERGSDSAISPLPHKARNSSFSASFLEHRDSEDGDFSRRSSLNLVPPPPPLSELGFVPMSSLPENRIIRNDVNAVVPSVSSNNKQKSGKHSEDKKKKPPSRTPPSRTGTRESPVPKTGIASHESPTHSSSSCSSYPSASAHASFSSSRQVSSPVPPPPSTAPPVGDSPFKIFAEDEPIDEVPLPPENAFPSSSFGSPTSTLTTNFTSNSSTLAPTSSPFSPPRASLSARFSATLAPMIVNVLPPSPHGYQYDELISPQPFYQFAPPMSPAPSPSITHPSDLPSPYGRPPSPLRRVPSVDLTVASIPTDTLEKTDEPLPPPPPIASHPSIHSNAFPGPPSAPSPTTRTRGLSMTAVGSRAPSPHHKTSRYSLEAKKSTIDSRRSPQTFRPPAFSQGTAELKFAHTESPRKKFTTSDEDREVDHDVPSLSGGSAKFESSYKGNPLWDASTASTDTRNRL